MKSIVTDISWVPVGLAGIVGFVMALEYNIGSAANIGSGVYPLILTATIFLVAAYSLIFEITNPEGIEAINPEFAWRPFAAIVASVVLFTVIVENFGIFPAIVLSMMVAYLGQTENSYLFVLVYSTVFALVTWSLFSYTLNLPLPLFQMP